MSPLPSSSSFPFAPSATRCIQDPFLITAPQLPILNPFILSDRKNTRLCTLRAEEFIRRFLQHVLPRGFVKMRYYGFFSSGKRRLLAKIRRLLGRFRLTRRTHQQAGANQLERRSWECDAMAAVSPTPSSTRGYWRQHDEAWSCASPGSRIPTRLLEVERGTEDNSIFFDGLSPSANRSFQAQFLAASTSQHL